MPVIPAPNCFFFVRNGVDFLFTVPALSNPFRGRNSTSLGKVVVIKKKKTVGQLPVQQS